MRFSKPSYQGLSRVLAMATVKELQRKKFKENNNSENSRCVSVSDCTLRCKSYSLDSRCTNDMINADGVKVRPLQISAYQGDLESCKLLVESGEEVNLAEEEKGYTPLMFAALSGKCIVSVIIRELLPRSLLFEKNKRDKVEEVLSNFIRRAKTHSCTLQSFPLLTYSNSRGVVVRIKLLQHFFYCCTVNCTILSGKDFRESARYYFDKVGEITAF